MKKVIYATNTNQKKAWSATMSILISESRFQGKEYFQ